MPKRIYPDAWYENQNPYPLKEYWYQQYVAAHPEEFGFTHLEGPFDVGPDFYFLARQGEEKVTVEVEKDYLAYKKHGHKGYDVLIVGVLEKPARSIRGELPRKILHLDPKKVLEWSSEARADYKAKMDREREEERKRREAWEQEVREALRLKPRTPVTLFAPTNFELVHGHLKIQWGEVATCKNCDNPMETIEADLSKMDVAKWSNHWSGSDRDFYCPGCDETSSQDKLVFYQVVDGCLEVQWGELFLCENCCNPMDELKADNYKMSEALKSRYNEEFGVPWYDVDMSTWATHKNRYEEFHCPKCKETKLRNTAWSARQKNGSIRYHTGVPWVENTEGYEICYGCSRPMEEIEVNPHEMSEEAWANYMCGFDHYFHCRRCDEIHGRDVGSLYDELWPSDISCGVGSE